MAGKPVPAPPLSDRNKARVNKVRRGSLVSAGPCQVSGHFTARRRIDRQKDVSPTVQELPSRDTNVYREETRFIEKNINVHKIFVNHVVQFGCIQTGDGLCYHFSCH